MARGEFFLGPKWYKGIVPKSPTTSARYLFKKRKVKTFPLSKPVLSSMIVLTKTRPVRPGRK